MLVHAFCMGLATVFFETAASALFLTRYPASSIAMIYVVAALVSTATGVAYARLERVVPFWRLMIGTLLFLFATVLLFRAALSVTTAPLVIAALFVWYRLLSLLTDVEYWAVATRLYDVQQSKRLYGVIGSGEVTARMAGSFAVPILVQLTGVRNLLLFSSMALLACALLVMAVRTDEPSAPRKQKISTAHRTGSAARLLADPYVRSIIAVAGIGILGKHFVDFSFLQQMQSRYADAGRLASIFGVFTGLTQAVNLLIRITVSRRFLQRFGIAGGLQALPLLHLLCTGALLIAAILHPGGVAVFWLVIANQGVYKTMKHPIDNPSVKVLYQPLPRETRLSVQVINELVATPLMIGVAGGVMLIFTRLLPFDLRFFGLLMLLTFLLWIAASRRASRGYVQALRDALRKRSVDPEVLSASDQESLDAIRAHAASPYPAEATYALSLLERSGDSEFAAMLHQAATHPSSAVRRFACERLGRSGDAESINLLIELIRSGDDDVAGASFDALLSCAPGAALQEARRRPLAGGSARTAAAVRVMMREGGDMDRQQAREFVEALASATDVSERAAACRIMGRSGDRAFAGLTERLLLDPRPEVRRAALEACALVSDRAVELSTGLLADHSMRSTATAILTVSADSAIPALTAILEAASDLRTSQRALRIAGRIGTPAALALIRQHLASPIDDIREQALRSLVTAEAHATPLEAAAIEAQIRRDAAEATDEWRLLAALPETHAMAMVRSALATEADRARQRIVMSMQLIDGSEGIAQARRQFLSVSREKRAYAGELLEASIPSRLRSVVLPLFRAHPRDAAPHDPSGLLHQIIDAPSFTSWTKACAAKALQSLENPITTSTGVPSMNDAIEKVIILKSVGFFATTPDDVLAQLVGELEPVDAVAGTTIIRKGDVDDSLYIIASGDVRVHDGDHTLAHLGEREVFGELAVLDPEPRSASVTATSNVQLLRLDRDDLFEILPDHVEMLSGILHVLCNRLRAARVNRPSEAHER